MAKRYETATYISIGHRHAATMKSMPSLYESDYFRWTQCTAAALRAGRLDGVDLVEVAEEIEDLGRSERRSLQSALAQLFLHLLKWDFQPERRTRSWAASIKKQRNAVAGILRENPSLTRCLYDAEFMASAYEDGFLSAVVETNLDESTFPARCPYTLDQILSTESEK